MMPRAVFFLALFGCFVAPGSSAWGGPAPDIDPALRAWLRDSPPAAGSSIGASRAGALLPRGVAPAAGSATWPVFIRFAEVAPAPDSRPGLVPLGDDLYAGYVAPELLREWIEAGTLRSARLSRPVAASLDRSAAFLGLESVRQVDPETNAYVGQTGRGVVVGCVDTGVDWRHPDFQHADGTTRLYRYWDQLGIGGARPPGYPYGAEYTEWYLNRGIAGGIDAVGHGTHVLGIAAGNGRASLESRLEPPLGGVATEATLVAVRADFTEVGVVLGARYVFEQAEELGLPAVLNLSLGNHFGPHRGTTAFESALADLVEPGHLLVAAAGNDGNRPTHAEMFFTTGESRTLAVQFPAYGKGTYPYLVVEGWYARSERLRAVVQNPLGTTVATLDLGDMVQILDEKGVVQAWHLEDLGMRTVYVEIAENSSSNRLATGTWTVTMEPLAVGRAPEMDWWLASQAGFPPGNSAALASHLDPEESVLSPACAPGILAVGALATRSCWMNTLGVQQCYSSPPVLEEVAYFSSRGPTPDGRVKPEILAPGFGVLSARSAGILPSSMSAEELDRLSTPDESYFMSQGTSMSAPHVAGAVALLLARHPGLTYDQAVSRFRSRALPLSDWRDGSSQPALQVADALAPAATLASAEVVPDSRGFLIRWTVAEERGSVHYRVERAFDPEGPFEALATRHIQGENPFSILDDQAEPGRVHTYRIVAVDALGLGDVLDTVSATLEGTPVAAFRPPDPNPARGPITFRTFVPPGPSPARLLLSIYDAAGRRVREMHPVAASEGGEGLTVWDLAGPGGSRVAAGVYFARLEIAGSARAPQVLVRRLVVLP